MDRAQEFINDFLSHFQSDYYDPVKAHEYYLRTRKLKGRQPPSALTTDAQKQSFQDAKDNINVARSNDMSLAVDERTAAIEQARATAIQKRQEIAVKLNNLLKVLAAVQQRRLASVSADTQKKLDKLVSTQKEEAKKISDEASSKIAALPPIPKGISKEQKAELTAKRSEEIAKIRGDANTANKALADKTNADRAALSTNVKSRQKLVTDQARNNQVADKEASNAERDSVGTELKASVEKARANYQALKESLIAQYDEAAQQQYEAIKQNV